MHLLVAPGSSGRSDEPSVSQIDWQALRRGLQGLYGSVRLPQLPRLRLHVCQHVPLAQPPSIISYETHLPSPCAPPPTAASRTCSACWTAWPPVCGAACSVPTFYTSECQTVIRQPHCHSIRSRPRCPRHTRAGWCWSLCRRPAPPRHAPCRRWLGHSPADAAPRCSGGCAAATPARLAECPARQGRPGQLARHGQQLRLKCRQRGQHLMDECACVDYQTAHNSSHGARVLLGSQCPV